MTSAAAGSPPDLPAQSAPACLADDLSLEALLDGAEAILERMVSQWRQSAALEVGWMIRRWSERRFLFRIDGLVRLLDDVAGDIEVGAEATGYPGIAGAARDVLTALLRVDLRPREWDVLGWSEARSCDEEEAVATMLAILRMRIAEGRHRDEIREQLMAA
jgi:hypothetical protein